MTDPINRQAEGRELFGNSEQLNDTISRAAVLALPRSITRNMRGEVVEETIDVAAIKALPPAQQWIPVTEWLPEFGQLVLCTISNSIYFGSIKVCRYCPADKYVSVPYFDWNENGFPKVVAWMPLPKPWKGEQDG